MEILFGAEFPIENDRPSLWNCIEDPFTKKKVLPKPVISGEMYSR